MQNKTRLIRRLAPVGMAALILLNPTQAPAAAEPRAASKLVKETADNVLEAVREGGDELRNDAAALHALVTEAIVTHFDFQAVSRLVLGKHWRKASPEQQRRFVDEFRTRLVRTYIAALTAYSDEEIVYMPARVGDDANRVLVPTEVRGSNGQSIPVTYRMYRAGEQWKVYDVSVEGISIVTTYRSQFAQHVRQSGLDSLIELLAAHNSQKET